MKFKIPRVFSSANPYRDWLLVLVLVFVAAASMAIMDARLFLSATKPFAPDTKKSTAVEFDREELARDLAALKDKEQRFNALGF